MKWIKLFEEYAPEESLSTPNIIFLKFFIDNFLNKYKRVDKEKKIEIVKIGLRKKDEPAATVWLLDEAQNSDKNSNRYNFIDVGKLREEFDNFLLSYYYGSLFYSKLCLYETEIDIEYNKGNYIDKRKLAIPYFRWWLIEQVVKKFLQEYETDILVNRKNIFPVNLCGY